MKHHSLATVAAAFGLLVSARADAFTLLGNLTGGWDTKELTFLVNESSCTGLGISSVDLNNAIDAAVDIWNSVPTSGLKLVKGGTTTGTSNANPPVIYCSTDPGNSIAGTGSAGILGGRIVLGSLELNGDQNKAAYFGSLTEAKRLVTVTHEIGHVLGLGHSELSYALMYYSIGSKADLRLSQDDMDAMTWLYPRDEFSDGVMGCATIQSVFPRSGSGGNGSGGPMVGWFFVLALAWVASRRMPRLRF
jgi:hypothetical protein